MTTISSIFASPCTGRYDQAPVSTWCNLAHERVERVKANVSIDWQVRESARARIRVLVKRPLRQSIPSVVSCGRCIARTNILRKRMIAERHVAGMRSRAEPNAGPANRCGAARPGADRYSADLRVVIFANAGIQCVLLTAVQGGGLAMNPPVFVVDTNVVVAGLMRIPATVR